MTESDPAPEPERRGRVPLPVRLIATGCFTGYVPWASGTFGSLAGLLLLLIPGASSGGTLALLIPALFLVGVYAAGRVAAEEGNRLTRSAAAAKTLFQGGAPPHPDPSIVVIDEIIGMWISLAGIRQDLLPWALAFLLFRCFDVLKPQPARALEHVPRGWGIMLDDVVAGVYANAATRVLLLLAPLAGAGGLLR